MRAMLPTLLCAALLPAGVFAGEPPRPAARADAAKPLCLVKITDKDGLPLAPMGLVAFEDGTYRLKTEEGREIEIAEKEVSSAAFMPTEKPRHDRRPPREEESTRARPEWPRAEERAAAISRFMREDRDRFVRLKRGGGLGREIAVLEKGLVKADTALNAATQMRRLVVARTVDEGKSPSEAELRRLVGTIEKAEVRERVKHIPTKYFLRPPGGPRGPAVGPRRRFD